MAYAPTAAPDDAEPLGTINVTPLIDVLLVLLIMLILTIPMATHSVPLESPREGAPGPRLPEHRLALTAAGQVMLDGAPISDAALPATLARLRRDVLIIDADPAARYGRFDTVLAIVRRSGISELGFLNNERFAKF